MPSTPPTPRRNRELLPGALAVVLAAVIAIIALAVLRITKDEDGDAALRSPRHAAVVSGCAVVVAAGGRL